MELFDKLQKYNLCNFKVLFCFFGDLKKMHIPSLSAFIQNNFYFTTKQSTAKLQKLSWNLKII